MCSTGIDPRRLCQDLLWREALALPPRMSRNGEFLRLKRLIHSFVRLCPKRPEQQDQDQEEDVEGTVAFPWIFAPYLSTLSLVDCFERAASTFSLSHMVEDIRLAREAIAVGRDYYLDNSNSQEQHDQEQDLPSSHGHYGLIPFSHLHTLAIFSHRGRDRDIAFLIDTAETLQNIVLEFPGPALQTYCALGRHRHHLTEVDMRFCDIDSAQVLTLLESCPRLEALAATEICAWDVVGCRNSWVCLGLKRLTVGIVVDASPSAPSPSSGAKASAAHAVFERIDQLEQLELLDIAGGITAPQEMQMHLKFDMGLRQLPGLKKLRHVCAKGGIFAEMEIADAEWMVRHWPQLETVQMRKIDVGGVSPEVEKVLAQAGVLVKRV